MLKLPATNSLPGEAAPIAGTYLPLFRVGTSVNSFLPTAGNTAALLSDSDAIVAEIDEATETVHLLFYIWLPDRNGLKVVEALKRAVSRGVIGRVIADDLGSRALLRSSHWKSMGEAGVLISATLPIGSVVLRLLSRRIDMRNHRKIVVIDNRITYCGSQICADAAFLPKAKYTSWVDIVLRLEGPVVRHNQFLFATDWMSTNIDDDLTGLLRGAGPLATATALSRRLSVRAPMSDTLPCQRFFPS